MRKGTYILAVTDGSAKCYLSVFTTSDLGSIERKILEKYRVLGARPFWCQCQMFLDLDVFMNMCKQLEVCGYLLDGCEWFRFENGKWSELERRD